MCWRIALLRPNIYLQTDSREGNAVFHPLAHQMSPHCGKLIATLNKYSHISTLYCKFIRGKMFGHIHSCCVRASLMSIKTASSPSKDLLNLFHLSVRLTFIRYILLAEICFMINIKLILEPRHFNAIHTEASKQTKLFIAAHSTTQSNQKWRVNWWVLCVAT